MKPVQMVEKCFKKEQEKMSERGEDYHNIDIHLGNKKPVKIA